MNTEPLLSIITATYNNGPLLPRFFESIINQTYQNWELVIVNDGSTDNTLAVCEEYAARDCRIKVYTQENQGQAVARNLALDNINGDLVAFIDGDDAIKPDTYQKAIELLIGHPHCDVVVFPVEWISQHNRFVTAFSTRPIVEEREMLFDLVYNAQRVYPMVVDKIYRRELLEGLSFVSGVVFDDNLMSIQVLKRSQGICFSLTGGYEYHQEEFDKTKNDWTPYKDYSQMYVNCAVYDELCQEPDLVKYRDLVYSRICNHIVASLPYRKDPNKQKVLECGKRVVLQHSVVSSRGLTLKQKVKAFYLKLRYIFGLI